MRTRRSPRNQEILWRELGGKRPELPPVDEVAALERILAGDGLRIKTRRQLERDLARAKVRRLKKDIRAKGCTPPDPSGA